MLKFIFNYYHNTYKNKINLNYKIYFYILIILIIIWPKAMYVNHNIEIFTKNQCNLQREFLIDEINNKYKSITDESEIIQKIDHYFQCFNLGTYSIYKSYNCNNSYEIYCTYHKLYLHKMYNTLVDGEYITIYKICNKK